MHYMIDTPSILFFLGILLAISALDAATQLTQVAQWMNDHLKNQNIIVLSIGMLSSVVDNVVPWLQHQLACSSLNQFPIDHYFWEFLAYCPGTGGSTLIIGSAAGVAAMEKKKNFSGILNG